MGIGEEEPLIQCGYFLIYCCFGYLVLGRLK